MSEQIDWKLLKTLQKMGFATSAHRVAEEITLTPEQRLALRQHIQVDGSFVGGQACGFDASLRGYHKFSHYWAKTREEAERELQDWMATHDWRNWQLQIDRMVTRIDRALSELIAEANQAGGDGLEFSIDHQWVGQGTFEPTWTVEAIEMHHKGLLKQRVLTFGNANIGYFEVLRFGSAFDSTRWRGLKEKVLVQADQWNRAWERRLASEAKGARKLHIEGRKQEAVELSSAAQSALEVLRHLLVSGIRSLGCSPRSEPEYPAPGAEAVASHFDRVLTRSEYPECIPRDHEMRYDPETGVLILNFRLPAPADLPSIREVRYSPVSDGLTEIHLSESDRAQLYDDVIYQITLRTIGELFSGDDASVLSLIVFNGTVVSMDKATGNDATACIVSVQVSREAFPAINLAKVDPKECFKKLKGVGSSKLHSITPIAPIVEFRRNDPRFVAPYAVAGKLDEGSNLAAMDWEDFEHLIREIFEKEFSSVGGEVKVTQASRDRGVDAVVFDPDPIRGGKLIIQAKRYAFTVDVSAVRDLYGTILNEGATKGILVTTSDYGPDAYEFAKGKPITLLNGANLLHLLQKHGVKAHIDLAEARKFLGVRTSK